MNYEGPGETANSYWNIEDLMSNMLFICVIAITMTLAIFYRVARLCGVRHKILEETEVRPPSERQYLILDSEAAKPNEDWNSTI